MWDDVCRPFANTTQFYIRGRCTCRFGICGGPSTKHLCLSRTTVALRTCHRLWGAVVVAGWPGSGQVLGDFGVLLSGWTHYLEGSRLKGSLYQTCNSATKWVGKVGNTEIAICEVDFRSQLRGQSCG